MRITGGVSGPDGAPNAQQLFKKIDLDGDGKLTKEEFAAAAPKRGGAKAPSVADLFSRIDTNGDGGIDESENKTFLETAKSHRSGSQSELETSLMSHFDRRPTTYSADGRRCVPSEPTFSRTV